MLGSCTKSQLQWCNLADSPDITAPASGIEPRPAFHVKATTFQVIYCRTHKPSWTYKQNSQDDRVHFTYLSTTINMQMVELVVIYLHQLQNWAMTSQNYNSTALRFHAFFVIIVYDAKWAGKTTTLDPFLLKDSPFDAGLHTLHMEGTFFKTTWVESIDRNPITTYLALIFRCSLSYDRSMVDKTVLGCVVFSFQRTEQRLLCPEDLYCRCRVLRQIQQRTYKIEIDQL